jgi:hypothetical protein
MEPVVAASILSALLAGLLSILAKIVEHKLAIVRLNMDSDNKGEGNNNEKEKTKRKNSNKSKFQKKKETEDERKDINERKSLREKLLEPRFLWRTSLLILAVILIIIFLYHTGIIPRRTPEIGNEPCPNRQNFPESEKLVEQDIRVKNGYVAYYAGWLFDGKDGGYFITFKGPYKASHTFGNGVYCPPIPIDTTLAQSTKELLIKECKVSKGGCSITRICKQSIFGYHLNGGVCNE